jgi:hypothetical protein
MNIKTLLAGSKIQTLTNKNSHEYEKGNAFSPQKLVTLLESIDHS